MVIATLATMIVYLICCAATIKLQRMNVRADGAAPFQLPGGPVIPVLACMIVIWLMTSSTRQEFIALAAMLAIEIVIFLAMKTRAAVPRPA
jgi:L-asparagine transporter-like permease